VQLPGQGPPPANTVQAPVYLPDGDRFSEDPFVLFQMRGAQHAASCFADLAVQRRMLVSRAASAKAAAKTAAKAEGPKQKQGALQRLEARARPQPRCR